MGPCRRRHLLLRLFRLLFGGRGDRIVLNAIHEAVYLAVLVDSDFASALLLLLHMLGIALRLTVEGKAEDNGKQNGDFLHIAVNEFYGHNRLLFSRMA